MRACHVLILWYMCMFYMLSINALNCDAVLFCMGSIMGTITMGPSVSVFINTLWQPERLTWSVYRITCIFWHDIIHVTMYFPMSYDVIYLWFMLFMLSIYDHWYDAMPSIMHNCHSITVWCVLVMLSFYGTCSTCHRSMHYAAMRYCIVRRPSWGPSLCDTSRWI